MAPFSTDGLRRASRELDQASLSRLAFWVETPGSIEVAAITPEDVDTALVKLAEPVVSWPKAGHRDRRTAARIYDREGVEHSSERMRSREGVCE